MTKRKGRTRTAAILAIDENVSEMEELASSAGMKIVYEIVQRRRKAHPATFVGKGKVREVKELFAIRGVDVLLINGELKPSQHYLLESELKVECMDRIRLVLEIFNDRASSREAQLQVQRARLRYEIPFLREWIHNAKSGEHPGFLGGGGYETDAYYELTRRQLARIEEELTKLGSDRDLRRKRRARKGLGTIALAGYTNAGKSSLLNAITQEKVLVEDRMFSTLSTTTARLDGCRKQLLVTDTIGFISNLPPFMVESFKSTLDEIFYADLVLLVIDSSDDADTFMEKLTTSLRVLFPDVDVTDLIVVLSKTDRATELSERMNTVRSLVPNVAMVAISSLTGDGLEALQGAVLDHFAYPVEMRFFLPHSPQAESFLSWLHDATELQTDRTAEGTEVVLRCRESDHSVIVRRIIEAGGRPGS